MEGSCAKAASEAGKTQHPRRERAIAEIVRRQHGVVALEQLNARGLASDAVRKRAGAGRLHRVHRGVYSPGHPDLLTRNGRFMAAVLACGPGAVLSHRSAAALHDLRLSTRANVDVTAPGSRGRGRPGIRGHSGATLAGYDVTLIDTIPTTTLARTLLDVADDATRREIERACDQADIQCRLDMNAIDDVLRRAGGRRGAVKLAAVLAVHRLGSTLTRNELEERFLAICRDAGLAPDAVNVWIPYPEGGGAEADFLWRGQRLIVEVDGRNVHTTRRAFEHDRRRDQRLAILGYRVIRFTWRQVMFEAAHVVATLAALL
jgi:predicted transcriptional regulator of viral defense system